MRTFGRIVLVGCLAGCEPLTAATPDTAPTPDAPDADDAADVAEFDAQARADLPGGADARAPDDAPTEVDAPTDADAHAELPSDVDLPPEAGADASADASGPFGGSVTVSSAPTATDPATLGALRLIAPLSTAVVTSRRPTLRWGPMPVGARARVTLCDDPACARPLAAADVDGASMRPGDPLRAGPVFWRVSVTSTSSSAWESPIWEFFVRPSDAPVDTTRCCVVDVNRDGVPDVERAYLDRRSRADSVVNAGDWSTGVLVSAGAGYQPSSLRSPIAGLAEVEGSCGGTFACSVGPVGLQYAADVDGDGFGDLALAYSHQWLTAGDRRIPFQGLLIYLVGGGPAFELRASAISLGGWAYGYVSGPLRAHAAGDVDGDGYGDLGVTFRDLFASPVHHGIAEGIGEAFPVHDPTYPPVGAAAFGFDADGDGRADRAYLSVGFGGKRLAVATRRDTTTWRWEEFAASPDTGDSVTRVGDLDGDGYEDLAARFTVYAASPRPIALVLRGGPDGYSLDRALPADVRWLPDGVDAPLLDVNGDGVTDRLGGPGGVPTTLYYGSAGGFLRADGLPRCTPAATPGGHPCGDHRHFSVGDFTRDGYDDLWVWHAPSRTLEVFAGGPGGFGAAPVSTTIVPP